MRTGSHGETLSNNFPLAGAAGSAYCIIFIFFCEASNFMHFDRKQ